jgi:hypothetical protein
VDSQAVLTSAYRWRWRLAAGGLWPTDDASGHHGASGDKGGRGNDCPNDGGCYPSDGRHARRGRG